MTAAPVAGLRLRHEAVAVTLATWLALVAIPIGLGKIGISWDGLNHHIYLGWIAQGARFDRDALAASYQALQFPYVYWPVYKLAAADASGVAAGMVLASLHATAVPAVWLIARSCIPGRSAFDALLRTLAVALAFCNIVVLSMFDSTSNDLLAAIPLVWSIALALLALETEAARRLWWLVGLSGLLAGVAVACKLSNGPLSVLGPVLWACAGPGLARRAKAVGLGCACACMGFLLAYGYWGWLLWVHYGNPVYPFADGYFEPLRQWLGWQQR